MGLSCCLFYTLNMQKKDMVIVKFHIEYFSPTQSGKLYENCMNCLSYEIFLPISMAKQIQLRSFSRDMMWVIFIFNNREAAKKVFFFSSPTTKALVVIGTANKLRVCQPTTGS